MAKRGYDADVTQLPFQTDDTDAHGRSETAKNGSTQPAMTVTELSERVRGVLSSGLPGKVRIVGEVSNFSFRQHMFFSLKDEAATLNCVCFASAARQVSFDMADGVQVVATGRIDYFGQYGKLQLYVDRLEPVGRGSLEMQLRAMIEELRAAGYLDEARKRALPTMPQRLVVVTSRAAAALQDFINTAHQRWPGVELLLADVRVQGEAAAAEIAAAINTISQHGKRLDIDAVVLTRGGGSIEDLWAFNERIVAEAIYACQVPVVAAIGHETDTTVAELVADRRCSTPTQAAMVLVPDQRELQQQLDHLSHRMQSVLRRRIDSERRHLAAVSRVSFTDRVGRMLSQQRQSLVGVEQRLQRAVPRRVGPARDGLRQMGMRLQRGTAQRLNAARQQLDQFASERVVVQKRRLQRERERLAAVGHTLTAVSPQQVLERGYSVTMDEAGVVLKNAERAQAGMVLRTRLAEGEVVSVVGDGGGDEKTLNAKTPRGPRNTKETKETKQTKKKRGKKAGANDDSGMGLFEGMD